jgi:hypothetical protein
MCLNFELELENFDLLYSREGAEAGAAGAASKFFPGAGAGAA